MPKIIFPRRRRARSTHGREKRRALSKSPNAIRLRRLRAKAVKRGLCKVCRCRYPKPGNKICAFCNDSKNERAAGYVAQGLCACGRKCARGKLRCKACDESNVRSREKRASRLMRIGKCRNCGHGWPKPGAKTCPSCIANINAYGILRRAVNQATGLCGCGRERMPDLKSCRRCLRREAR